MRERIAAVLRRLGLDQYAHRGWQVVRTSFDATDRALNTALREDYQRAGGAFRRMSEGAPTGDPDRRALFVCSMTTAFGRKLEGVLSLVTRLAGLTPHFLELGHDPWGPRYHGLFGPMPHHYLRRFQLAKKPPPDAPGVSEFERLGRSVQELIALSYRRVDIGRVALSNCLTRNKFNRLDIEASETRQEIGADLRRAQHNVRAAEALLDEMRPSVLLLLEKGLSPAAEVVGVALARDIPVIQYVGSQRMDSYVFKRFRYEGRHQHPFSLSPKSWSRARTIGWDERQDAALMQDLAESYVSGTWFNRKFLHQGKSIKGSDVVRKQLDLDPRKKTATVFSHVLWDATFFYGEGLFDDYETWLCETVKAACANPRLNWIIKLHPDLVWKLQHERFSGELRDVLAMRSAVGALPPHVKIVLPDTDISTYSFFPLTDYCVTVRGTIGIEMACHGVPVVTAGTGRYSGLGFTIDSVSAADYLSRLASLEKQPPLGAERTRLAQQFAHTLFNLRPWRATTFEMVKMAIEDVVHPLATNLEPRVSTFTEFEAARDTQQLATWIASDEADYLDIEASGAG